MTVVMARGSRAAPPRERILDAADALFYDRGVRAVSIEDVVDRAETTRMTLYRHYPSKDDLVLAYLRGRAERERAMMLALVDRAAREQRHAVLDLAAQIRDDVSGEEFSGCPLLGAAAEFRDPGHPVRRLVAAHRAWYRAFVVEMVAEVGAVDAEGIADRIVLLRDGAMVGGCLRDEGCRVGALQPAFAAVLGIRG